MNATTSSDAAFSEWVAHIIELRTRVMVCVAFFAVVFAFAYWQSEAIYMWLAKPLGDRPMIYTGLTEAFMTYIRLALYVATLITAPFAVAQLYLFAAPGLYKREKKASLPVIAGFPILFTCGVALAYYGVMPAAWDFFAGFERRSGDMPLFLTAKVGEYLSLTAQLCFAFGMAFQFPLIMAALARAGAIGAEGMRKKRKIAIVGAALAAAVLTPPDVVSQILLAIPLIIFYELTILICARIEKKRANAEISE